MKKALLVLSLFLCMFFLAPVVQAADIDENNVKELISKANIVPGLTYGRETKHITLTDDWTIPAWDMFGEADFRFYVMKTDVLKTPRGGRYQDFIKNIVAVNKGSYKKGDEILVVLLHKDIPIADFKNWIFRPWLKFDKNFGADTWYYMKIGNQWYGKVQFALARALITGVENFRDFVCNGPDDPDFIEINGNSITVAKLRNILCFHEEHNDLYLGKEIKRPSPYNVSVNGVPLEGHYEAEGKTTFVITPIPEKMPQAWADWK